MFNNDYDFQFYDQRPEILIRGGLSRVILTAVKI